MKSSKKNSDSERIIQKQQKKLLLQIVHDLEEFCNANTDLSSRILRLVIHIKVMLTQKIRKETKKKGKKRASW
ncbi:MAG: hypothetical protein RR365_15285 [Bacteroides sp.]